MIGTLLNVQINWTVIKESTAASEITTHIFDGMTITYVTLV